jgi:hypothetical protein
LKHTITDTLLRREVYLQRFASHLIIEHINKTIKEMARLAPRIIGAQGEGSDLNRVERNAAEKLITKEFIDQWTTMWAEITTQLEKMALLDADHVMGIYNDIVDANFTMTSESAITTAVKAALLSINIPATKNALARTITGVWAEFVRTNTDKLSKEIVSTILSGYQSGKSNSEIVTDLRGNYNRSEKRYMGGIITNATQLRNAATLVRTGTNHYANAARDKLYLMNADIIDVRILFATLDNRTTPICYSRNLREYDINDDTYPRLPFHFNERSVYIVQVAGTDALSGMRPSVGGKSNDIADYKRKPKYRGRADTDVYGIKRVSSKTTTDQWLRDQPDAFILDKFGPTRGRLFLDGGFSVNDFTDANDMPLTIDQLRNIPRFEKNFKRAGLD